ncbi:MAG TPA: hypothetical protein VJJ82_01360 [Candidatus Nanoarchaeia archaeon]|nr:hypothetical protein [Candidatus Nanoarchaeia archaeon]
METKPLIVIVEDDIDQQLAAECCVGKAFPTCDIRIVANHKEARAISSDDLKRTICFLVDGTLQQSERSEPLVKEWTDFYAANKLERPIMISTSNVKHPSDNSPQSVYKTLFGEEAPYKAYSPGKYSRTLEAALETAFGNGSYWRAA